MGVLALVAAVDLGTWQVVVGAAGHPTSEEIQAVVDTVVVVDRASAGNRPAAVLPSFVVDRAPAQNQIAAVAVVLALVENQTASKWPDSPAVVLDFVVPSMVTPPSLQTLDRQPELTLALGDNPVKVSRQQSEQKHCFP